MVVAKRKRQALLDSVNDVIWEGSASGRYLVYDIVGVAISYTFDNVYQKVQSDYTIYNINLSGLVSRIKLVSI